MVRYIIFRSCFWRKNFSKINHLSEERYPGKIQRVAERHDERVLTARSVRSLSTRSSRSLKTGPSMQPIHAPTPTPRALHPAPPRSLKLLHTEFDFGVRVWIWCPRETYRIQTPCESSVGDVFAVADNGHETAVGRVEEWKMRIIFGGFRRWLGGLRWVFLNDPYWRWARTDGAVRMDEWVEVEIRGLETYLDDHDACKTPC